MMSFVSSCDQRRRPPLSLLHAHPHPQPPISTRPSLHLLRQSPPPLRQPFERRIHLTRLYATFLTREYQPVLPLSCCSPSLLLGIWHAGRGRFETRNWTTIEIQDRRHGIDIVGV